MARKTDETRLIRIIRVPPPVYNAPRMSQAKVLIVDDEADLLGELKPLLERSGFEVAT